MDNQDLSTPENISNLTTSTTPDSSPALCSERVMETSPTASEVKDLPASAYDGSHLPWKTFRQHVLTPYRISIIDIPPRGTLPEALIAFIGAQSKNLERFNDQKEAFREQLTKGRGFGPSQLFPPNLLPSIENEPQLARCMIPTFGRDALPERDSGQLTPLYELAVPRPGLGCGFDAFAFSDDELAAMPPWLQIRGTSVDFDAGYITQRGAIYCPFLTFERTYGTKEHRLEAASNKCAIDGAWCCKALQMLFTTARQDGQASPLPVSFSCNIDNDCAVINYHWIDHDQAYYMSPLCRFDLEKDDHFNHFAAWIDAIGQWATTSLLPQIRDSLEVLRSRNIALQPPPQFRTRGKLTLHIGEEKNELLIKALKTTFESIPWRVDAPGFTPVSSSTASWGSPVVDDAVFSNLGFTATKIPSTLTVPNTEGAPVTAKAPVVADGIPFSTVLPHLRSDTDQVLPPPDFLANPELVWQRRFNHAMDEIRDLQARLQVLKQALSGSSSSFRKELSGLRTTLGSVLRKETIRSHNRSLSIEPQSFFHRANTETQSPSAQITPLQSRCPRVDPPPRLQLSASTKLPSHQSELHKVRLATPGPGITLSMNEVDLVPSPKEISTTLELPTSPCTAVLRSSFAKSSLEYFWGPDTPGLARSAPPTPGPSAMDIQSVSLVDQISPDTPSVYKWIILLISSWVLGAMVPPSIISTIVIGCVVTTCLRAAAGNNGGLNIAQFRPLTLG